MISLIYHPRYNITAFGLERLHPFDGRKYRRIHDALIAWGLRHKKDFVRPQPAAHSDLLRVHTTDYLQSLRRPKVLANILEVPIVRRLPGWAIDWRILRPMRYARRFTAALTLGHDRRRISAERWPRLAEKFPARSGRAIGQSTWLCWSMAHDRIFTVGILGEVAVQLTGP